MNILDYGANVRRAERSLMWGGGAGRSIDGKGEEEARDLFMFIKFKE